MAVSNDYVYLDWAATTPLCEEAARAMAPYMVAGALNIAAGGNANSLHTPGRDAYSALEDARRSIARDLGAKRPAEIVFTSGATESDNTAIVELSQAAVDARNHKQGGIFTPHIITTTIEHEAILAPCERMEKRGYRVTYLVPDKRGFVSPEALAAAIDVDTVLVSVQMANSEVGAVQPIAELARVAHAHGALMHTDATQALGKVAIDLDALGVDAASFSAHKLCGPKGVGALYVRAKTPWRAFMLGGGQESGRRSGTQNVCGIVGFAAACHAAVGMQPAECERLTALRDKLYAEFGALAGVSVTVQVDAGSDAYLPNIVHVLVDKFESETMILRLDAEGFGVSGGSACSSHSLEPSHVLKALGVSADRAYGALRISMGRYTTEDDIDRFIEAFTRCIA